MKMKTLPYLFVGLLTLSCCDDDKQLLVEYPNEGGETTVDSLPVDTLVADSVPADTLPPDSLPSDSVVEEGAVNDSVAADSLHTDSVSVPPGESPETEPDSVLDGWVSKDFIGLGWREVHYGVEGGCDTFMTRCDNWWICNILIDGKLQNKKNIEDPDFETDYGWLSLKREGRRLVVSIEKNHTGVERTFEVALQLGDLFNTVVGTQSAR